jgi:stage III sporulation protein AE
MRKLAILLTILVILPIFSIKSYAFEEHISEFYDILPEDMSSLKSDSALLERLSVEGILGEMLAVVSGEGSRVAKFFLTLIGVILLFTLLGLAPADYSEITSVAVGILSSSVIFETVRALVSEVLLSLDKISGFFASFIPISVGLTALGGGESTAAVQGSGMYVTLSLLSSLSGEVFATVSAFGLASALLSPLGGGIISQLSGGVKSIFTHILGILTALITAVFSLQSLVSGAVDSAAMRAARYMASGLIPVVGSTVSGALSTLASGMSYAKGIIGGGAVTVIILTAISPLVILLLYRLSLSVAMGISSVLGSSATPILSAYRGALDMALGLYALSTLIYLFEIIIFLKSGVNII